ncbi:MAG: hypothetical protein V4568_12175 [Pseudomonadota bacterium]
MPTKRPLKFFNFPVTYIDLEGGLIDPSTKKFRDDDSPLALAAKKLNDESHKEPRLETDLSIFDLTRHKDLVDTSAFVINLDGAVFGKQPNERATQILSLVKKLNKFLPETPISFVSSGENKIELNNLPRALRAITDRPSGYQVLNDTADATQINAFADDVDKLGNRFLDKKLKSMVLLSGMKDYIEAASKGEIISTHTPGHFDIGLQMTVEGLLFRKIFGKKYTLGDVSISVGELGELIDHEGLHEESEHAVRNKYGVNHTYFFTSGTSGANRGVLDTIVGNEENVAVSKNSHKSFGDFADSKHEAIAHVLPSLVNSYGISGPPTQEQFNFENFKRMQETNQLGQDYGPIRTIHFTHSSYEGLTPNAAQIMKWIEKMNQDSFKDAVNQSIPDGPEKVRLNKLIDDMPGMTDGDEVKAAIKQVTDVAGHNLKVHIQNVLEDNAWSSHTATFVDNSSDTEMGPDEDEGYYSDIDDGSSEVSFDFYGAHSPLHPSVIPPFGVTLFVPESIHKLSQGISQASIVNIKEGIGSSFNPDVFKETTSKQQSTSPSYPIAVSNELGPFSYSSPMGRRLLQIQLKNAVEFMRDIRATKDEHQKGKPPTVENWYVDVYAPDRLPEKNTTNPNAFDYGSRDDYVMNSLDAYHGFGDKVPDEYLMGDPIKQSVILPGQNRDGSIDPDFGIPGKLLAAYLEESVKVEGREEPLPRVYCEKNGPYSVEFLFHSGFGSVEEHRKILKAGIDQFKLDHDQQRSIKDTMPRFYKSQMIYDEVSLQDKISSTAWASRHTTKVQGLLPKLYELLPDDLKRPDLKLSDLVSDQEYNDDISITDIASIKDHLLRLHPYNDSNTGLPKSIAVVANEVHQAYREIDIGQLSADLYTQEPETDMPIAAAFNLTSGKNREKALETVNLDDLVGRVSATKIGPYPPGIPLIYPGQIFEQRHVDLFKRYASVKGKYPGLGPAVHGMETKIGPNGEKFYTVSCITESYTRKAQLARISPQQLLPAYNAVVTANPGLENISTFKDFQDFTRAKENEYSPLTKIQFPDFIKAVQAVNNIIKVAYATAPEGQNLTRAHWDAIPLPLRDVNLIERVKVGTLSDAVKTRLTAVSTQAIVPGVVSLNPAQVIQNQDAAITAVTGQRDTAIAQRNTARGQVAAVANVSGTPVVTAVNSAVTNSASNNFNLGSDFKPRTIAEKAKRDVKKKMSNTPVLQELVTVNPSHPVIEGSTRVLDAAGTPGNLIDHPARPAPNHALFAQNPDLLLLPFHWLPDDHKCVAKDSCVAFIPAQPGEPAASFIFLDTKGGPPGPNNKGQIIRVPADRIDAARRQDLERALAAHTRTPKSPTVEHPQFSCLVQQRAGVHPTTGAAIPEQGPQQPGIGKKLLEAAKGKKF